MSNFKGHSIAGLVAASATMAVGVIFRDQIPLTTPYILAGGMTTYLFALFPDLDTKSTPSKIFYLIVLLILGGLYLKGFYKQATLVAIFSILPQILNHRGFLHSLLASFLIPPCLMVLYILGAATPQVALFLAGSGFLGYQTHLLLDRF
jgi:membrane-bound metal-dependent hydrolase YbcI (DUF457 family)